MIPLSLSPALRTTLIMHARDTNVDELLSPTTKANLSAKIDLLSRVAGLTGSYKAMDTLKMIVAGYVADPKGGVEDVANIAYFDKLVNQVVRGERVFSTLGREIATFVGVDPETGKNKTIAVPGVNYHLCMTFGIPLPTIKFDNSVSAPTGRQKKAA